MGEIGTIFQNAILYVAGNEGMEKFSRAGYDTGTQKIIHPDGSLDLPQLMNILLDVFPEEQASAITDNVLAKYVEMASEEQRKAHVAVEDNMVEIEPAAAADEGPYEDNLAKYLATDASDVRDLINEARKIRLAMGKTVTMKVTAPPEALHQEEPAPIEKPSAFAEPEKPAISIVAPILPNVPEPKWAEPKNVESQVLEPNRVEPKKVEPKVLEPKWEEPKVEPASIELSQETLEGEIRKFIVARKAYSSIDIMDFIRYLKDKGYHFQENIVLADVYTWLEERKSRERAALMADILGFLASTPWPTENEVSAFIEQKKSDGVMCESSEIKRMILVEMIRKH